MGKNRLNNPASMLTLFIPVYEQRFTKHSSGTWAIIRGVNCYFYGYGMRTMKAHLKTPRMVKLADHHQVRIHVGAFWSALNTFLAFLCLLSSLLECVWALRIVERWGILWSCELGFAYSAFVTSGWLHLYALVVGSQERKRQGYIDELIETEEKYIEDLQLVLEVRNFRSLISHSSQMRQYTWFSNVSCDVSLLSSVRSSTSPCLSQVVWRRLKWTWFLSTGGNSYSATARCLSMFFLKKKWNNWWMRPFV